MPLIVHVYAGLSAGIIVFSPLIPTFNLTPFIPLSFKGEGEGFLREASPLFNFPLVLFKGLKGAKPL